MSRPYELTLLVFDHDQSQFDEIVHAVRDLGFEAYADHIGERIVFNSEGFNMNIGNTEAKTAKEIQEAVWKANGKFCQVHVGLIDLDAGQGQFLGDAAAYDAWASKNA